MTKRLRASIAIVRVNPRVITGSRADGKLQGCAIRQCSAFDLDFAADRAGAIGENEPHAGDI